ncbi:MAG: hypothetical protein JWO78_319 [Micavibrio sp.]|nr:hypothetical protein [Micavibrio sp.]
MRTFLIIALLALTACAEPAANESHPFDKFMTNGNTVETSRDNAPPCAVYGCGQR